MDKYTEKLIGKKQAAIRKDCKLTEERGGTVPYSLDQMISANVPVSRIRKVYRSK